MTNIEDECLVERWLDWLKAKTKIGRESMHYPWRIRKTIHRFTGLQSPAVLHGIHRRPYHCHVAFRRSTQVCSPLHNDPALLSPIRAADSYVIFPAITVFRSGSLQRHPRSWRGSKRTRIPRTSHLFLHILHLVVYFPEIPRIENVTVYRHSLTHHHSLTQLTLAPPNQVQYFRYSVL